jgi:hypothetical protein
MTLLKRGRR